MVLSWFLTHNTQLDSRREPYSAVQCIDIRAQTVAGSGLVGVAVVGAQLVPDLQHPAGQLKDPPRVILNGFWLFWISELGYANP